MPAVRHRKRVSPISLMGRAQQVNGFYIHSNPPKALQMNPSVIRQWLRGGEVEQLEQVVLEGQGHKLIGEYAPDPKVRAFLKHVPDYMTRIGELNDAVNRGNLKQLQKLAPDEEEPTMKNAMMCKDFAGAGLLHKAVYNDHPEIVKWLVKRYPQTVALKDRDGKTALHYCGVCGDPEAMWNTLLDAGADASVMDARGRTAAHYMERPGDIQLPEPKLPSPALKRFTSGKNGLVVKPSNIRIWIHDRDMGRLQQVLWEGHGNKLRVETSNNAKVKKFLDAVPHIMNVVKDVHTAVINDDVAQYMKKTADPAPVELLNSKDSNGLTPLHKAAGLGHKQIAQDIIERLPKAAYSTDNEGRTPLHYAAAAKDGAVFALLVEHGADEMAFDNSGRLPSFYRTNPKEIPQKWLENIPEAPRTSVAFPPTWDWSVLTHVEHPSADQPREHPALNTVSEPFNTAAEVWSNEEPPMAVPIHQIAAFLPKTEYKEKEANEKKKQDEENRRKQEREAEEKREKERKAAEDERQREKEKKAAEEKAREEANRKRVAEEERKRKDEERKRKDEEQRRIEEERARQEAEEREAQERAEDTQTGESDEASEWELAKERQRLLDDGLLATPAYPSTDDAEVDRLIAADDLNGLANLVLEGEGGRLMGRHSHNGDVQSFLDNVPVYMSKIEAVHSAAREGDLRALQAALDRRRFAVAKDTPLKGTPLHVATLFGKTPIIKYLGGRFPESLRATDTHGRTALHYAASLPDNGHYFNILLNLGADRKIKDKFGNTAQHYMDNPDELTQEQLLMELSAPSQLANEILSDKEFGTDDGKYLTQALGRPLTQGLTEIASRRPADPVAHLGQFLQDFSLRSKSGRVGTARHEPVMHAVAAPSVENEAPPPARLPQPAHVPVNVAPARVPHADSPRPGTSAQLDEPPPSVQTSTNRDEYGQSILHFAAARAQGRNGLFQLIHESGVNIGYRDELYRTARDVAVQANIPPNVQEIDKYVLSLAARGETERLIELLLEGYDHLLDIEDDDDVNILDVVGSKQQNRTLAFLRSVPSFEEKRERLHRAIRAGDQALVQQMMTESEGAGRLLSIGKSTTGRGSLHLAVLCQFRPIVEFIAMKFPETLQLGDNLERTALHYVMAMDDVEELGAILVKCGAQRVAKDLKGRQPSYYFMNKSEIQRLREEELLLQI